MKVLIDQVAQLGTFFSLLVLNEFYPLLRLEFSMKLPVAFQSVVCFQERDQPSGNTSCVRVLFFVFRLKAGGNLEFFCWRIPQLSQDLISGRSGIYPVF